MRRVRSRVAAGIVAMAVLVSACASGSDGDAAPVNEIPVNEVPVTEVPVNEEPFTEVPVNEVPVTEVPVTEAETPEVSESSDVAAEEKDIVTRAPGVEGDGVLPVGVDSVTAMVTSSSGDVCEVCLWLADDDLTRQRGLMGVTDLGNAVGMAFVWDQPRSGNFVMFQTPTPLSIAWFDDAGSHVGQADMDPCVVDNSAICERYTADSSYVVAVEMFDGQLDVIGIGPGASIELLDLPCV